MITGPRSLFAGRLLERGYTLDEVRGCIVSEDADQITVDESHPAYPRERKAGYQPLGLEPQGPGTELKAILKKVGIEAKPGCACNKRAAYMDKMGPDWCEENMDQIVGWLKEEHERQKIALPFIDVAARMVVKRAIRNARKKANSQ